MPLDLENVQSGYNLAVINENFQRIEDSWDEKLDRLVSTQPNQMEQELDMNSNKIINHPPTDLESPTDLVRVDALSQFGDFTGSIPVVASYTGDGSTVAFPKPVNANDARTFQVYVGGLRQEPYTDYQIVGESVVFEQAPVLDVSVDIYGYSPTIIENGAPVYAEPILADFIGDGTTVNYFVSAQGSGTDSAFISIDGVNQVPNTDFTNAGGAITFTEAPPLNSEIFVRIFAPFTNNATDSLVIAEGSTEARSLGDRFGDTVNVLDFGAVGDGVADDYAAIQSALDYASLNKGHIVLPDTGNFYRVSDTLKVEADRTRIDCLGTVAPHGAFTGYLWEVTTNKDGSPFFGGSDWLWPKQYELRLRVDGRSPDMSVKQSKGVFLNRVSHSIIHIFGQFCTERAVMLTGCIESDLFITLRMCGKHNASYVTFGGVEYCCQRNHSTSQQPDTATDYWTEVPTGSAPNNAPSWVGGASYENGSSGSCLYLYDPVGAPDANNNLRFYGYNAAYPEGCMLEVDCDQSQFGARNLFFYGAQLHHQDGDLTGTEGSGQPNYPGPTPAAENKQSHGVGVELKNAELVHFIGGNWRKGTEAGGTLWHFGDSAEAKAVRAITFSQGVHSGNGGTATGTSLTLFDFDLVSETLNGQGIVLGDSVSIRDLSAGSNLSRGDSNKLVKAFFGRTVNTLYGGTTSTAYEQYVDGESFPRTTTRADGRMSWGSGAGAQDTGLVRNGAGLLYVDQGKLGANEGFIIGSGYTGGGVSGSEIGTIDVFGPGGGLLGKLLLHAPS